MTDLIDVAIGKALLARLAAFATVQSPALPVSYPNIDFQVPPITKTAQWLRATILPANTLTLGISNNDIAQYYGLFQIDVFQGQGIGEPAPGRVAAAISTQFARGTLLQSDGFTVQILQVPYRLQMMKDDPWVFIPVRVPYFAYASPA